MKWLVTWVNYGRAGDTWEMTSTLKGTEAELLMRALKKELTRSRRWPPTKKVPEVWTHGRTHFLKEKKRLPGKKK